MAFVLRRTFSTSVILVLSIDKEHVVKHEQKLKMYQYLIFENHLLTEPSSVGGACQAFRAQVKMPNIIGT